MNRDKFIHGHLDKIKQGQTWILKDPYNMMWDIHLPKKIVLLKKDVIERDDEIVVRWKFDNHGRYGDYSEFMTAEDILTYYELA